jgi:hypothetical protein
LTCTKIRKSRRTGPSPIFNLRSRKERLARDESELIEHRAHAAAWIELPLTRSGLARRQPCRHAAGIPRPTPIGKSAGRAHYQAHVRTSSTLSRDHGAASSSALSRCLELCDCGPPHRGCFAPAAPLRTPCAGAVDIVRTTWRMHLLQPKHASGPAEALGVRKHTHRRRRRRRQMRPAQKEHPTEYLDVQNNTDDDDGNCAPRARPRAQRDERPHPPPIWMVASTCSRQQALARSPATCGYAP